ncbi:hypothetical protein [Pseudonocardia spinosispora]|uniref:hypothetical protein n=1 Tax=Pseudonocardia spinosispora TaxID=103441 RepID=UPI00040499D5|nr:hypothetical protein [Pseudonocardia spinosispora]
MRVRGALTDEPEVDVFPWQGRILPTENSGGRILHADPAGCWITGPDGIHRIDPRDGVRQIDDTPIAVSGQDLLLIEVLLGPGDLRSSSVLGLLDHRATGIEVELGSRATVAAVALDDGSGSCYCCVT